MSAPHAQAVSKKLHPRATASASDCSVCSSSSRSSRLAPHAVADFREFPTRSRILAIAHDCEVGLRGQVPVRRGRSDVSGRASVRPFRARTCSASPPRGPWPSRNARRDLHWTRCNRTHCSSDMFRTTMDQPESGCCRRVKPLALHGFSDGCSHEVAPLGPRSVAVLDVR